MYVPVIGEYRQQHCESIILVYEALCLAEFIQMNDCGLQNGIGGDLDEESRI